MADPIEELAGAIRAIRDGGQILIVTGAGISLASGIPTFRGDDPGAIWKRDVTELGTHRFFIEDPAGSWQWYLSRFSALGGAKPNPGHRAIAALERWQVGRGGDFLLVTQNVDTLHEQAGSTLMVKVHGSSDKYRCDRRGCRLGPPSGSLPASEVDLSDFLANPTADKVPRCPACGGFLRLHVLWFDEYYHGHDDYRWGAVTRSAGAEARLVVFAGTSFAVGVTDMVLQGALGRGVPVFNVDPTPRIGDPRVRSIAEGSETALVKLCDALGIAIS